jgi:hypothetical protein
MRHFLRTGRRLLPVILPVILAVACRSWDQVRKDFVDPFNQFLHQDYAKAWVANSLDQVLSFYAPPLSGDAAHVRAKQALLARFTKVEYAQSIIGTVQQQGSEEHVQARLLLKLRGEAPGGKRLVLDQWYDLECKRAGGRWGITREALLSEDAATGRSPSFTEESTDRGLLFTHASRGVLDANGQRQSYSAGSGLAVGDYDADGLEDIFLVGGAEPALFRNRGDGTFGDVTRLSLVLPPEGEYRCAAFADYDNDGHQDLFVGVLDAPNLLYRNRGDGTFEEVAARAGLQPTLETVAGVFADFNRDGHLDLYIVNGGNLLKNHPDPLYNALNSTANVLYLANGDGTFRDATAASGVGHTGWGLAVSTTDYDLDGDTDIFVGNDVGFSVLYRNRGDGTFDNVTLDAGVSFRGSTMSVAWGDVNRDGYPDLFTAAMDSNSRWMIDQPGFPSPAPWYVNLVIRWRVLELLTEMLYGNRFYMNRGDGTFVEVADASGVRRNGWAWSALFLDYDNDSNLDIYGVNGFISGQEKKDL